MKQDAFDFSEIKAVIFDMDGTMVDNNEFHKRAFQAFCRRYGKTLSDEAFMNKFVGRHNNQLMPMVFEKNLSQEEIAKYGEEKEAIYRELYATYVTPVKGLYAFLAALKQREIKLAIATGAILENRNFVLQAIGLIDTFHEVVGGEEVINGKPAPDVFLLTAKKLGVSPQKCVVFEDAPAGITAAKRAGMQAIAISTTHKKEELKKADLVIKDFSELL